ncbi:Uncharacterized protein TCM_045981 [Theobroma cacao]|uniref:Uncharacterized protein n=1 Tax=Theobroma cacao TaxID=3641 RepID=S1RW89_THECC|nr:Uncharacterized protein TCM_045981 [Theobroma cacao]
MAAYEQAQHMNKHVLWYPQSLKVLRCLIKSNGAKAPNKVQKVSTLQSSEGAKAPNKVQKVLRHLIKFKRCKGT